MKNLLLLLLIIIADVTYGQITISGSNGQDGTTYTSLTNAGGAFAVLNAANQTGKNIIITITADVTSELGTNDLTGAAGMWTTLKILPSGIRTISGSAAAGGPIINLNGADNVKINGLNDGINSLTISNLTISATSGTSTLKFMNDATYDTIINCNILGSSTVPLATNGGNIWFSAGAITTGNDNNSILNCKIGPAGSNLPSKGIYASGTTTSTPLFNSNITISNCEIYNYFLAGGCAGIYLGTGNTGWTITGNSFYETASRALTGSFHGINITNSSGNGFIINNNYIGGSAANCGGSPLTLTSSAVLQAIYLNVGTASTTAVNGNTISNISMTTSSTSAFQIPIYLYSGQFEIGTTTGNIIGSQTTTANISVSTSSSSVTFAAIAMGYSVAANTFGTVDISNNLIGGISISGTGSMSLRGIDPSSYTTTPSGALNINNNTVGSTTVPLSFTNATLGSVFGIIQRNPFITPIHNITNNTIANIASTNTTGTGVNVRGINAGSAVTINVTGNTVFNISSSAPNIGTGSSASVIGIYAAATGTLGQTLSGNTVYNISNTSSAASSISGICVSWPTSGTNIVSKNKVWGIYNSSTTGNSIGIDIQSGTTSFYNNIIALGTGINSGLAFTGVNDAAGTNNYYFNSVYIGGSAVTGTAATYAFKSAVTANTRNFQNNIFYNARSNSLGTGKHYALSIAGTSINPAGLTINYNDYFANGTGGVLGYFNSLDVSSFAAWKTAVGQDVNSINSNPTFINPTAVIPDLHINSGSPCIGAGLPIASVTNDYDGNIRKAIPDIGADETATSTICTGTPAASSINGAITICSGTGLTLSLSTTYTDPGITYLWKYATISGGPYSNLGTTATITTGTLTTTTYYICTISCSGSGLSNTTTQVAVNVTPLPVGGIASATTSSVCSGTGTTISLSGSTGNIQWQSSPNGTNWANIIGQTSTTLNTGSLTSTTYYQAVVTSGSCGTSTSTATLVSITASPIGGTASSTVSSVCSGGSTSITLSGNTGNIQWQSSPDGTNWANIIGQTSTTLNTGSLTSTTYYQAVVTSGSCGSSTSTVAFVSVSPVSVGGTASATTSSVCSGTGTIISLSGSTGNVQWQSSSNGTNWANIIGQTSTTLNTGSLTSTTYYQAVVTSGSCGSSTSTVAFVSVSPVSVGGTASATTSSVCSGTGTTISLSGSTGNIQWQSSSNGNNWANIIGQTSTTLNTGSLTATTYYQAVVTSGSCGTSTSTATLVSIAASPIGGTASSTVSSVCSGGSTSITLSGSSGNIQWQSSPNGTNWADIIGQTSTTLYIGSLTSTTYYQAVVTSGICGSSTSTVVMINVDPIPIAGNISGSSSLCSTSNSTLLTLSGYTGNIIRWESSLNGTVWNPIPNTLNTYTAVNVTVTTQFRAIVQSGVCSEANSGIATITVDTPPAISITSFTNPSVCSAANGSATVSSALSYSWNTLPVQTTQTATGLVAGIYLVTISNGVCSNTISVTLTDPGAPSVTIGTLTTTICAGDPVTFTANGANTYEFFINGISQGTATTTNTYTTSLLTNGSSVFVKGITSGCAGNSSSIMMTVNPLSNGGVLSGSTTVCSGNNSITLTLNSYVGSILRWESSINGTLWTPIVNTLNTYTANNLTATTQFRVVVQSGVCNSANSTVATITVTPMPTASISYSGTPYCNAISSAQSVVLTGTTSGTYAAGSGLTINANSGEITPNTSTAGTYTVTYTIAAADGCGAVSTSTTVTIITSPSASISYSANQFCNSVTIAQIPLITGTQGGEFSTIGGLSYNSANGAFTPNASAPGIYNIVYTIAAAGGCATATTSATITISSMPAANISYPGSPYCKSLTSTQTVTHTGTSGGTFSSTSGLVINTLTGSIIPSTSNSGTYTVTYTIAASGGCSTLTTTTQLTITNAPAATITYAGSPFCKSLTSAQPVTLTGTAGGTFSSTAGLSINTSTGVITPNTSTVGTYTVTYTIAAGGGCSTVTASTNVSIILAPSATIAYAASPFCKSLTTTQAVTLTGTTGGIFTSGTGLTINSTTGAITPNTSTAGTYTVTYTIAAAGGCATLTATAPVIITTAPTATISYTGSPFCKSLTAAQAVSLTGTTGGVYSGGSGLTINSATGAIIPSTSTAGTYTVTYTIAASGGCAAVVATTAVTITAAPSASISYAASPYCKTISSPQAISLTGTTGGVFSSGSGLSINSATGAIIPSTSTAGTYTVTYTIAAAGGCTQVITNTTVVINAAPTATISYTGSPYCKSLTSPQSVTLNGTSGGTFSSTTAGLSLNTLNGSVNPSASNPGTYIVTYSIPASGGCSAVVVNTTVKINAIPTASISYLNNPFCSTITTPQNVILVGTTSGTYSAGSGLSINSSTGSVNPSVSTSGTYTVTYTIAAAGGCSAVTASTTVSIENLPAAAGTITTNGTNVIPQSYTTQTFYVPYITNAITYLWSYSGTGIVFLPSTTTYVDSVRISFGPAATSGVLTVKGQSACGNGAVSAGLNIFITYVGIDENNNSINCQIFPNPTNGIITVKLNGITSNLSMQIIDIQGKSIHDEKIIVKNQTFNQDIDLSAYPKGMYFVKLTNNNFTKVEKIVLQ